MVTRKMVAFLFAALITLGLGGSPAWADNPVEDSVITTKVKAKLLANKILESLKIGVTTKDGVVFLEGNVKSDTEASAAVQEAFSTLGVVDVDATGLKIKDSKHPIADTLITAKVKGVFIKEKLFGDKPLSVMNIHVETKNGVVYLKGTADSAGQASTAVDLAKAVKGVKDVKSDLKAK